MGAYVDDLQAFPGHAPKIRGRDVEWCHLFADTPAELHRVAHWIGLRREWYQAPKGPGDLPHYDLVAGKRRAAIDVGAVAVDRPAAAAIFQRIRATFPGEW